MRGCLRWRVRTGSFIGLPPEVKHGVMVHAQGGSGAVNPPESHCKVSSSVCCADTIVEGWTAWLFTAVPVLALYRAPRQLIELTLTGRFPMTCRRHHNKVTPESAVNRRRLSLSCWPGALACLLAIVGSPLALADAIADDVQVAPQRIVLHGVGATHRVLIMHASADQSKDVTELVAWKSEKPAVASVRGSHVVATGPGTTRVLGVWKDRPADRRVAITVEVKPAEKPRPVSFELDVQPILVSAGCSVGECHGKARGQKGFQLSLLGYDPDEDYAAIVREGRGRRVFPASPAKSLLLLKGAGIMPHGGGRALKQGGADYRTLLRWIESGMPRRSAQEPTLLGIELFPKRVMMTPRQQHGMLVIATYSDGTTRDVTDRTDFHSNENAYARVDADTPAIVAGALPGETAVMARYMGHIQVCRVLIPAPPGEGALTDEAFAKLPRNNFIDELVWAKLRELRIPPTSQIDDATFLRRAYVDIIGTIPTAEEARRFLDSKSASKRSELVDELLDRPEYAEHWSNKWMDLLRPNPYRVGIKTVLNYDHWIRSSFRENKPYDRFARELLTATGSTWRDGAPTLFRDRRSPDELASMVSQIFLGVRLDCAKCHQHPFEVFGQDDFYSFAAYFARVGRKGTGLSPPISGSEEMILVKDTGEVEHPKTGKVLPPRPLFSQGDAQPISGDRRVALVDWMTSPDNPFFARVMVNRIWADMMGRGLVVPIDDLRATNPASNEALLDALAKHFRESKYDLKAVVRVIANSAAYSLSSVPNGRNAGDLRNYARHYRSRLRAEVLLDAVQKVTGVTPSYSAMPAGSRPQAIWTHRIGSVFLDTFGRPNPNEDPPCERLEDGAVTQALHLMNSPTLAAWIADNKGRAAELAKTEITPGKLAEVLYLSIYSRYPKPAETAIVEGHLRGKLDAASMKAAIEDLMWVMLNTPEFSFKH